jgi:hypothetical protein
VRDPRDSRRIAEEHEKEFAEFVAGKYMAKQFSSPVSGHTTPSILGGLNV